MIAGRWVRVVDWLASEQDLLRHGRPLNWRVAFGIHALLLFFDGSAELYRAAADSAAAHGKDFGQFVAEVLKSVVGRGAPRIIQRNGIPVVVVAEGTPAMDPALIREAIEEEGV